MSIDAIITKVPVEDRRAIVIKHFDAMFDKTPNGNYNISFYGGLREFMSCVTPLISAPGTTDSGKYVSSFLECSSKNI